MIRFRDPNRNRLRTSRAMSAITPKLPFLRCHSRKTQRLDDSAVVQRLDVAARHRKGMAILAKLQDDTCNGVTLKPSHIFSFYENVVNKNPQNAQQKEGDCIFCGRKVPSTGPYRWVTHMINCAVCPRAVRDVFAKQLEATESKAAGKREATALISRLRHRSLRSSTMPDRIF